MSSGFIRRASVLLLAVAGLTLASCKKDKSKPNTNPGTQTKKLVRIEENGATTASVEYNADGTIKKVTAAMENNTSTFTFTYDAQKRPTEFVSNTGYKAKYVYQNNVLTHTENYDGAQKVSESVFTYENGKVKSNTMFTAFPEGGGNITYRPTFRTVYHYYQSGALQKTSTYTINPLGGGEDLELMFEYVYQTYDNKKNPLTAIGEFSQVLMYQPVNANNPLIEKLYSPDGEVEETTENVYTYDANGYPLTCTATVKPRGETPTVKTVKYFYQ